MISVCGMGWIGPAGHGAVRQAVRRKGEPERREVFLQAFRNFGRLDPVSRMTCYAVGLALGDASFDYPSETGEGAGIVGTSATGCSGADMDYFGDYVDGGRTLGRGNLFIYTLPSSPLAEAAIHFGLKGCLLFAESAPTTLSAVASVGASLIYDQGMSIMLAGMAEKDAALYMVLARKPRRGERALCSIDKAMVILDNNPALPDVVSEFERLCRKKEGTI